MPVVDDKAYEGHVMNGIGQCLALNVVVFAVVLLGALWLAEKHFPRWASHSLGIATRYFGIVQWLYVIPVWRYLRKAEYKQTGKGWLIAASVTVLVNGTCTGFLPM
jgi:membrane protein YdbS with pleckstrin-like domain